MAGVVVTEGTVPFRDWETWFRISGEVDSRPPLVCLHGGPGSTHHYFSRLESLAETGRAVIVYDQVGCGRSTRPPVDQLALDVFIDELVNLREQLGLERVHVLGTSWGGMLAIEYGLLQPRGLLSLVLSSTLACTYSWADEARRLRDEMPEHHRRVLSAGEPLEDSGLSLEEAELAFERRHVCRLGATVEIRRMRKERSKEVYRAIWGPNEWTPTGELAGWDVRDRLPELDVPILITAGRYDLCTPAILRELEEGLPHAKTIVFDASSHTPYLEESDAYVRELSRFLDQVGGEGTSN
ncbi:MAG TPA: proline iminopeptidase-family hydrolase [Actinomycetota bacterium]|nr:proline iminopeptidase-family hydrolase [Actinomycetota bacterium]